MAQAQNGPDEKRKLGHELGKGSHTWLLDDISDLDEGWLQKKGREDFISQGNGSNTE